MLLISEARQGANFLYFCYATAATLLCGGGIENLAGANFVQNSTFQTKCEVQRATLYSRNKLFPSFLDYDPYGNANIRKNVKRVMIVWLTHYHQSPQQTRAARQAPLLYSQSHKLLSNYSDSNRIILSFESSAGGCVHRPTAARILFTFPTRVNDVTFLQIKAPERKTHTDWSFRQRYISRRDNQCNFPQNTCLTFIKPLQQATTSVVQPYCCTPTLF